MTRIRDSRPGDADALAELKQRATETWTQHRETLAAHPDAIAIPRAWVEDGNVRVAEDDDGHPVGFAVTIANDLDSVYVDPQAMQGGIGRALVEDAAQRAREAGASALHVSAIAGSRGFYERLGFVAQGDVPSRFGPSVRMRLDL